MLYAQLQPEVAGKAFLIYGSPRPQDSSLAADK